MMDEPERFVAFRLALHWQVPDPAGILERLPDQLVNQWLVFFSLLDGGATFKIGDPDAYVARTPRAIYDALKDHLVREA